MSSQYITNGAYKQELIFLYFCLDATRYWNRTGLLYSSQILVEEGGGGGTYHGFVIGFFVGVVGRLITWWYDEYE